MTEHHPPSHGGRVPAARVVPDHWLLQAVEQAGTAAVNRLPIRLRPHVLRATRQTRPSRKIAAAIPVSQQTIDGVHITWLGEQRRCSTLLYLHGGAFLAGPISGIDRHDTTPVTVTDSARGNGDHRLAHLVPDRRHSR